MGPPKSFRLGCMGGQAQSMKHRSSHHACMMTYRLTHRRCSRCRSDRKLVARFAQSWLAIWSSPAPLQDGKGCECERESVKRAVMRAQTE